MIMFISELAQQAGKSVAADILEHHPDTSEEVIKTIAAFAGTAMQTQINTELKLQEMLKEVGDMTSLRS